MVLAEREGVCFLEMTAGWFGLGAGSQVFACWVLAWRRSDGVVSKFFTSLKTPGG